MFRRSTVLRVSTFGLMMLVCGAPEPATARAAAPSASSEEVARKHFEDGVAQLDTAEYEAALQSFSRSYRAAQDIEDDDFRAGVFASLYFKLAESHIKVYELDNDRSHLIKARELLSKLPPRDQLAEEERALVERYSTQVDELLAAAKEPDPAVAPPPEQERGDGEDEEPDPEVAPPVQDDGADKPPARGLIIGGATLSALSLAGFGVMTYGLVRGNQAIDQFMGATGADGRADAAAQGQSGNAIAIAGGITGGALLVGGAVMLALGVKRKRDLAAVPNVSGTYAGLSLIGRF